MVGQKVTWSGRVRVRGSTSTQRMVLLTFGLIGLQFTWGVEMSYFTPYLLQLGLAKSETALVWIAPPLSGLVVQPLVGTLSDSSRLRWGRRRPYMLVSSIVVAAWLIILAWAAEIVTVIIAPEDEKVANSATLALAILCVYMVDFAINAVQATSRSLIVDTLSMSEQQTGSAWAGRMLGLGHLLGYLVGSLDLMTFFGNTLGGTQFKQICVIASATLVVCVGITCCCVEERTLVAGPHDDVKSGVMNAVSSIVKTARHLPRRVQTVCWITFWSWIGWSPFFVYGSTWVGETYYHQNTKTIAELAASTDVVGDVARKGSLALFLFSVISFTGSVFLPWIVPSPTNNCKSSSTTHSLKALAPITNLLQKYRPDMTTAWAVSQLMFAGSMILTPFSHSFQFATSLIALCGIPWAMYGWAPLALMGEEINQLRSPTPNYQPYSSIAQQEEEEDRSFELADHSICHSVVPTIADLHPAGSPSSHDSNPPSLAGVYLGIWNVYATIPQFLATFISMIAFSILEPGKKVDYIQGSGAGAGEAVKGDGDTRGMVEGTGRASGVPKDSMSGTAVCLAIGAICSIIAATRIFRLKKMYPPVHEVQETPRSALETEQ